MKVITLPSVGSTNSAAVSLPPAETPHGTVVSAVAQTAGRGQRGNSWESEPGKNLSFSMVLRPAHWPVTRQFELSMAVSVGVARALSAAMPGVDVRIKWPNDIYVGDGKMVGMLLENTLTGSEIARCIAGIGINVNQRIFRSDAPNPVSMAMLTGREYDLDALLAAVAESVLAAVDAHVGAGTGVAGVDLSDMSDRSDRSDFSEMGDDALAGLVRVYHALLWRNDGAMHRWLDTATLQMFNAAISHVDPAGPLHLIDDTGRHREYLFKQVAAVLTPHTKS